MPEAPFIPRRKAGGDELDFERLRAEAIGLIEQVSGRAWSDYNLHDPGITILEQLIYAITDLGYRCDFPVQDYLANGKGGVDFEAQSLYRAHEIFPCRPTTAADYRKLLLDALPEIDNLWLEPVDRGESARGLYRLALKLARDVTSERAGALVEEVKRIYRGARNLCEDLDEVFVVDNCEYELCAQIEVGGAREPAAILAQIYFDCAQRIASSPVITTYDQVDADSIGLDRLFDGPRTDHGFFVGDEDDRRGEFSVSSLFATVNRIPGVEQIRQLCLRRQGRDYYDQTEHIGDDEAIDLAVPASADEIRVSLTTHGRVVPISISTLRARYDEIRFKYYASRSTAQKLSMLYRPIEAGARQLQSYFSIQDQFPAIYGVNRFGVPESASAEVKGRVRQLKAYLLIFEQLLVNFLANLDSLDRLFSPQTESKTSYATQVLDAQQVADLDAVYPANPARVFRDITAAFDNFNERKGRLLDYLLALYGERFNQRSLRHFNYYYARNEVDDVILANKVAFLEAIVELGRDRGAAPDFSDHEVCPVSGLARRAALLLDLAQPPWLTGASDEAGLELCSQQEYEARLGGSEALRLVDAREIEAGDYGQPPQLPPEGGLPVRRLRDRLAAIAPLEQGLLSETLLREGIDMRRYRVGRDADGADYRLCFELERDRYWRLGQFDDEDAARRAANDLRQLLLQLNRLGEGVHTVEHLMLRPRGASAPAADADFYSFRVSAVLPAWTRRCRDDDFRNLVCETLRLNAPAHLFIEFYWLEFGQMREFEKLYRSWLDCMREADADNCDRQARALVEFLQAMDASPGPARRVAP